MTDQLTESKFPITSKESNETLTTVDKNNKKEKSFRDFQLEEYAENNLSFQNSFNKERERYQKLFNKQKRDLNDFRKETDLKIEDTKTKINQTQLKLVESLGIFIALFTFISTSFQIFQNKDVTFNHAVSLILIIGGVLMAFILALHLSFNLYGAKNNLLTLIVLILFMFSLIFVGLYLLPEDQNKSETILNLTPTPIKLLTHP